MRYINNKSSAVLALLILLFSCDSDLLIENPPHLITAETLYTSYTGFDAGINGLYALVRKEKEAGLRTHQLMGGLFLYGNDNTVTNHWTYGAALIAEYWKDHNNPTNEDIEDVFSWLYQVINSANTIINSAEKNNEVDWSGNGRTIEENKNGIIAEARAIRAWAYRHLTFAWGDVPLNLEQSSGSTIKTDWTRTPVKEVRTQIIKDLLFAEEHIGVDASIRGRITKGAIQHYLAEMYLTLHDYPKALDYANKVIGTPEYKLISERYGVNSSQPGTPFTDMFLESNTNREEGNSEALWVFQFGLNVTGGGGALLRRVHFSRYPNIKVKGVRPLQATYDRGGVGFGRVSLTKWAIDNYESQDDRFSEFAIRKFFVLGDAQMNAPYPADVLPEGWSYGDTLWLDWSKDIAFEDRARANWPFSRKVQGTDPNNMNEFYSHTDLVYLRLAETYLIKAEAEYLLGRADAAANTLNIIRERSNASPITAADVDIDFILDERSRELVMEEHRRWSLIRTGKLVERVSKYNHNGGEHIAERDTIYPLPQSVIDANITQKMVQNKGW